MNFSKQQADPRRHAVGLSFVVLLHVLVVYALVTGLAKKVVDVVRAAARILPTNPRSSPRSSRRTWCCAAASWRRWIRRSATGKRSR